MPLIDHCNRLIDYLRAERPDVIFNLVECVVDPASCKRFITRLVNWWRAALRYSTLPPTRSERQ